MTDYKKSEKVVEDQNIGLYNNRYSIALAYYELALDIENTLIANQ